MSGASPATRIPRYVEATTISPRHRKSSSTELSPGTESVGIDRRRYHTSHLCAGFIFESLGQLNSVANSGRFESGPITLYLGGL